MGWWCFANSEPKKPIEVMGVGMYRYLDTPTREKYTYDGEKIENLEK